MTVTEHGWKLWNLKLLMACLFHPQPPRLQNLQNNNYVIYFQYFTLHLLNMMKKFLLLAINAILLLTGTIICNGQTPAIGRSWKFVATQMPDSWYGSAESKAVAENVLLYQRDAGGWPKNIAMHKPLTEVEKVLSQMKKEPMMQF